MKNYIPKSTKSKVLIKLINEALEIISSVGIPLENISERALEKMAMSFLVIAGVTKKWNTVKSAADNHYLKTRDVIIAINKNFKENISLGSYDDIRRKDLKLLVLANLITNSGVVKGSATNNPTRGYALHTDFKELILSYKTNRWEENLKNFNNNKPNLAEILARKRNLEKVPVKLPDNKLLELSLGEHNILQKAIIEQFLPRFGSDCEVLYVGDTSNKMLHIEDAKLKNLKFFELSHDELPDIIAYSKNKNWLYLIEAVHSSGPMSETRLFELKSMLKDCTAELIFVTGFLKRADFRKWTMDIAWETEVWIADNPDHLIHFNGHKFLGPIK
jgi:BsuBI/PstI restriction endonuclease domain/BsuBI/PstI restriction endonuclease HTH domain